MRMKESLLKCYVNKVFLATVSLLEGIVIQWEAW